MFDRSCSEVKFLSLTGRSSKGLLRGEAVPPSSVKVFSEPDAPTKIEIFLRRGDTYGMVAQRPDGFKTHLSICFGRCLLGCEKLGQRPERVVGDVEHLELLPRSRVELPSGMGFVLVAHSEPVKIRLSSVLPTQDWSLDRGLVDMRESPVLNRTIEAIRDAIFSHVPRAREGQRAAAGMDSTSFFDFD